MTIEAQDKLREITAVEDAIQFRSFSLDDAWTLGTILVRLARDRSLPLAIDVRLGTQRAFHAALPGATADNDAWIERKARVVTAHSRSSLAVRLTYEAQDKDFDSFARRDPRKFAAFGGGVPIRVGTALVGVATVSGLPHEQDHALVIEALLELRASID